MKDKKAISFQKKRCDCLIWPMFVYSKKEKITLAISL